MEERKDIHIGTSGWHYNHWRGPFYPHDLPKGDFLTFYARRFRSVELNNSFYQLPKRETLALWREETPSDFIFTVKGSRFITHMKKLKDASESLPPLLEAVNALEHKLAVLLFQLPPHWHCNAQRLKDFLKSVPSEYRMAFEFRDETWFNDETYRILSEHGAAFCIYDLAGTLSPKEVTADFIYVRLHGPDGPYKGQYDTSALSGWAGAFSTWVRQGKEIFCYFDNDEAGYAAQDALTLQKMLTGE
jgi:uncharacterized protein YecE (DUF72 family)